jgi:hypothetical protein
MTTVQYHLNLRFIKFNAILKFTTAANMTAPRKMDFANQISIKNPLRPYLILSGKIGKTLVGRGPDQLQGGGPHCMDSLMDGRCV